MNFLRLFLSSIFFLFFGLIQAQNNVLTKEEILKRYDEITPSNDEDVQKIDELISSSKEIDYNEGISKGKIKMLYFFYNRSDFKKVLEITREIEDLDIKDNEQLSAVNIYKSYANKALGIEKEELRNIKDALRYARLIEDENKKHIAVAGVYNRYSVYYDYKTPDSLINYLKKELQELEEIKEDSGKLKTIKNSKIALNNINIGNYYLGVIKPQRLDLAEPFYMKIYNYKTEQPDIFEQKQFPILCGVARFYLEKGEYKKAIEIANEVLERENRNKNPLFKQFAYQLIADSNEGLKNSNGQAKYTKLYAELSDSLNKVAKKEVSQQFDKLVSDVEEQKDEEHNSNLNILLVATFGFVLVLVLSVWFYLKNKKEKYEKLIDKIKSENLKKEIEEEVPTEIILVNIENGSKEKSTQITDATIHSILSKLERFEKSDKYLKNEVSLSHLASQLGTNTKYLSETIKQYKGKSFSNYINGLRINYIATLLYNDPKYREYKISYLAELSGFSSREVFAVVFKKETGVTPSYYIDNLKK